MHDIDKLLQQHIEQNIIPMYDTFDMAHRRDHVKEVIRRSMDLAMHYDVEADMVYAIAAYHDTGLCEGREHHEETSGKIIRTDNTLDSWFNKKQIETMAEAAEDHRASSGHEPRSIYGKIVAEADRLIDPDTVIRRTIEFGLCHYPQYGKENQYQRFRQHMLDKYSDTGYIKLWLPESENGPKLEELRIIIRNECQLRDKFDIEFETIKLS